MDMRKNFNFFLNVIILKLHLIAYSCPFCMYLVCIK